MNNLETYVFVADNKPRTSSILIAERFGKLHKNVIQAIKGLDCSPEFAELNFKLCFKNNELQNGKPRPYYEMTRDGFMFLVMGFTGTAAASIKEGFIGAFNAMEAELQGRKSTQSFDPTSLSRLDLIKIAMEAETERLALESRVKQMEPKVDGFDRLIEADGAVNLQSAAKALQQRPNKFCDWLRSLGWIYRRPGGSANLGYQDKVQCGYIRHKVVVVSREDGTEKVCEQALITPKGLAKLSLILNSEGAL